MEFALLLLLKYCVVRKYLSLLILNNPKSDRFQIDYIKLFILFQHCIFQTNSQAR